MNLSPTAKLQPNYTLCAYHFAKHFRDIGKNTPYIDNAVRLCDIRGCSKPSDKVLSNRSSIRTEASPPTKYLNQSMSLYLRGKAQRAASLDKRERVNTIMIIDTMVQEFPRSFLPADKMLKRLRLVPFIKCPHCLRNFTLPPNQQHCTRVCQSHKHLNKDALLKQSNWSAHKMLYFCTSCKEPLNFFLPKIWTKHSKVCFSCYKESRRVEPTLKKVVCNV